MRRFLVTAAFLLVAFLTTGSARLHACSCARFSQPCAAEWTADAIFVGEVLNINQLTEPEMWGSRRVTFVVRESFKGIGERVVDVFTGSGGGDCGFGFTTGSSYLVFAGRSPTTGRLGTGTCSKTALLSWSNDQLKLLRRVPQSSGEPTLLQGSVTRYPFRNGPSDWAREAVPGLRVQLMGQQGTWETRTAVDGRFEFRAPLGRYRLTVESGDGYYSQPDASAGLDVRLVDAKACSPIDIRLWSNGRVRGRLIDSAGRPVSFLTLDIAKRADSFRPYPEAQTMTDREGRFAFDRLAPGDYNIGLTLRTFVGRKNGDFAITFGADAQVSVGIEAELDAGTIRLPGTIHVQSVTGVVVDDVGEPVPNAEVRAVTPGRNLGVSSAPVVTDALGQFEIAVVGGRAHQLVAEDRSITGDRARFRTARSSPFDAAKSPGPVTMVVRVP
jgi:hypothetical protein